MRSKSELFLLATQKNALRREAQLPLLDVRAEMARQAYVDQRDAYYDEWERRRATLDAIKADVLAELRAERGPDFGLSAGGRWMVQHLAVRRYIDYLAGLGFHRPVNPTPRRILYGQHKS